MGRCNSFQWRMLRRQPGPGIAVIGSATRLRRSPDRNRDGVILWTDVGWNGSTGDPKEKWRGWLMARWQLDRLGSLVAERDAPAASDYFLNGIGGR